jgi:hypothetical protein
MKNPSEKSKSDDIEKITKFLVGLGFVCNSYPSAENLIFLKNKEKVIIKNNSKKVK